MSQKTYQLIAFSTLPFAVMGAYVIGRPIAEFLSALDEETSMTLALLGYVLGLLVAVVVWGVFLAPLRARAGFLPIAQDLAQIRAEGLMTAVRREQSALVEREHSSDPTTRAQYHELMALVAGMLTLPAVGLTWALFEDGYIATLPAAAALVCPVLGGYHLLQRFRWAAKQR